MIARRPDRDDRHRDDDRAFSLERAHERRILSWSPDPVEEDVDEPAEDDAPEPEAAAPPPPEPQPRAPQPEPPAAAPAEPVAEALPATAAAPKRRGRPRGRPRRQVHFHVDPDEELLLLEAAKKHGSQQKGLIAALQALQDNDVLRDEIDRLRAECEQQRLLLADAEAIFKR